MFLLENFIKIESKSNLPQLFFPTYIKKHILCRFNLQTIWIWKLGYKYKTRQYAIYESNKSHRNNMFLLFQGELEGLLDKFDGFQMSSSSSLAFKTFKSVYTFRVASLKNYC